MSDQYHSVGTLIDEGEKFIDKSGLTGATVTWGGMVWGLMRAIAECPNCPGRFRTPLDPDWHRLHCANCGYTWTHEDAAQ